MSQHDRPAVGVVCQPPRQLAWPSCCRRAGRCSPLGFGPSPPSMIPSRRGRRQCLAAPITSNNICPSYFFLLSNCRSQRPPPAVACSPSLIGARSPRRRLGRPWRSAADRPLSVRAIRSLFSPTGGFKGNAVEIQSKTSCCCCCCCCYSCCKASQMPVSVGN